MSEPVALLIANFGASAPAIENEIASPSESVAVNRTYCRAILCGRERSRAGKEAGERSLTFVTVIVKPRDTDAVPSLTLTVSR